LLRARNVGQIPFVKPELEALCTRAWFLSQRLQQKTLTIAGE